jgi:hypothetical protein
MTQTRSSCIAICVSFFGVFSALVSAKAGVPSLEWDPNPEPYVAGYNVYVGEKSRTYTRIVDVGLQTSLPLTNLNPGVTHYFAVTAYDSNRLESPFSDEVSYTPRVDGTNASNIPLMLTLSEGGAVIHFAGVAGQVARIVASSDLDVWEEIYNVTLSQERLVEYIDHDFSAYSTRFYRVVAVAAPSLQTIALY